MWLKIVIPSRRHHPFGIPLCNMDTSLSNTVGNAELQALMYSLYTNFKNAGLKKFSNLC